MVNYQDRQIVIVGLGLTGLSCVNFFLAKGNLPKVIDTRPNPPGLEQLPEHVERHLGGFKQEWLQTADLIVVSPGLPLATPELQSAIARGVEVIGDIELFCREVTAPVIAITGSNGKSTVTTLVGEMAQAARIKTGVGGNLGAPVLTLLQQECQLYVLELSSFQLETTYSLQAIAATVLNISEDHMDRYPQGIEQYRAAKLKIYHGAQTVVVNQDDPLTATDFSAETERVSFGLQQADYCLSKSDGVEWLQAKGENVLPVTALKMVGSHNMANALAAFALADAAGIPRSATLRALQQFSGLPHRFQVVKHHRDVLWINDSKATNVGSTEAALRGIRVDGTLHLLLGGQGKAADFSPLKEHILQHQTRLYCFGQDREQLAALQPEQAIVVQTMQEAVEAIVKELQPGDVVLLSPACASLDQFRNFEQRGDEFARLAQELG